MTIQFYGAHLELSNGIWVCTLKMTDKAFILIMKAVADAVATNSELTCYFKNRFRNL